MKEAKSRMEERIVGEVFKELKKVKERKIVREKV